MKHQKWIDNLIQMFDETGIGSLQQLLTLTEKSYFITDSDQILPKEFRK